ADAALAGGGGDGDDGVARCGGVAARVHGTRCYRGAAPAPQGRGQALAGFGGLGCLGGPSRLSGLPGSPLYRRRNHHCWASPSAPLVTQYRTRPAGKKIMIAPKITGISCMMRCCMGSMPVIGLSFCVAHITAMLMTGRMNHGSGAVRSWIQPIHGAWRSSTDSSSTQYRAKKIGICSRIGRQPPTGLIFSFLYSSIIAIWNFCLSSP